MAAVQKRSPGPESCVLGCYTVEVTRVSGAALPRCACVRPARPEPGGGRVLSLDDYRPAPPRPASPLRRVLLWARRRLE